MLPQIGSELLSAAALLAAVGVWVVSDWSIAFAHRETADDSRDQGSKYAIGAAVVGGVLAAVVGGVLAAVLLSQLVPSLSVPAPTVAFWLGIGAILLGVVLRQYPVRTLGDGFDLEVSVDADDEVVDSGPYRWVRHPSYTGALLSLVGVGITVGSWLSIAVALAAGGAVYGYRIRVEEQALRDTLGERYAAYASQTPYRLVPGIW